MSSKQLLNCTHEVEWAQFRTHCFSENLVVLEIKPGPRDLWPGTLTARPQMRPICILESRRVVFLTRSCADANKCSL
jgi:hypothetical protein